MCYNDNMNMIKLPRLKCKRCNYVWVPRSEERPKFCPSCKSPYWDKERIKEIQLPLLNIPKTTEEIYQRLGFNPLTYDDKIDIKKGLPGQSENTLIGFFPKLGVGIDLPNGTILRIERRNLPPNIYDIDFHILGNENVIAYIDNEQRDSYIFENLDKPVNIPLDSFRSNIEQWQTRRLSAKVSYYKNYPAQCFHLARSPSMNEAICCWAKDFVYTNPVVWKTFMGMIKVWQVPRERTCYGKINEQTIEDWVLSKLEKEGFLK